MLGGRGQTGAVKHVVLTEVRETSVWLKRGGVLQWRIEHHGVWRGTGTWVKILSRSIMITVKIRRCHLARDPSWVVWVCLCVLL